jgi:hypothetical protein
MEGAKRARTAETPTQPSSYLMLRAPYFYPNLGLAGKALPVRVGKVRNRSR